MARITDVKRCDAQSENGVSFYNGFEFHLDNSKPYRIRVVYNPSNKEQEVVLWKEIGTVIFRKWERWDGLLNYNGDAHIVDRERELRPDQDRWFVHAQHKAGPPQQGGRWYPNQPKSCESDGAFAYFLFEEDVVFKLEVIE